MLKTITKIVTLILTIVSIPAAAFTAFSLFYGLALKPEIDYDENYRNAISDFRTYGTDTNDLCLKIQDENLSYNDHIHDVLKHYFLLRREAQARVISNAFLYEKILEDDKYNKLSDFLKWSDRQMLFQSVYGKCPMELRASKELKDLQIEIDNLLPLSISWAIQQFIKDIKSKAHFIEPLTFY